jgi:hypothetical protein
MFDDNICDTLMCVDTVQIYVVEFVLRNKRKGSRGTFPRVGYLQNIHPLKNG